MVVVCTGGQLDKKGRISLPSDLCQKMDRNIVIKYSDDEHKLMLMGNTAVAGNQPQVNNTLHPITYEG